MTVRYFADCVRVALALSVTGICLTARVVEAQSTSALGQAVQSAYEMYKGNQEGAPADYIPELANVPADLFGIALITASGESFSVGDIDYAFTIQSVSKPFTAALVMQQQGADVIVDKVGVEPTGLPFNSILATQILPQVSVNPLVNSGAIATVSLVEAKDATQRFQSILQFFEQLSGSKLSVIEDVYASEAATNQRNRAHGYILAVNDRIYSEPLEAVDVYTRQCSIGVSTKQLAAMGATLANAGENPLTKKRVLARKYVPKVLSIMMTAGFYNESGKWAFTAGLPAKTGVGGGIVAVVPGRLAIAAFSPRVNSAGNSVRAALAIEYISEQLGLNVFGSGR